MLFSVDEEASRHRLTATGSGTPALPSMPECQSRGCLDKWRAFDRCPFSRTFTRRCTTKCKLCLRSSPRAARSALSLATSSGTSTKAHVRLSREPRSSIPSSVPLDRTYPFESFWIPTVLPADRQSVVYGQVVSVGVVHGGRRNI